MNRRYLAPRALGPDDVVETFECRSVEQTQWLRRHARQANSSNSARVLVVTEPDHDQVVAYYVGDGLDRPNRGAGTAEEGRRPAPQPVALLARLGVSAAHEGRGLGAALLQDVISRSVEIGQEIGCRGLLVHAESPQARDFYVHLIPEFEPSPTDELHLVLMMKDIMRTLR